MGLKQIKNQIKSTQKTSKVTKAMEAVSAVKMRKSQERALDGRPYAEAALRILGRVSGSLDAKNHPLTSTDKGTHECFIVITSDKGLAGNLNSAVLKEATVTLSKFKKDEVDLVCFGRKAYEHFSRRGFNVTEHHLNVSDDVVLDDMYDVVHKVSKLFAEGKYKTVSIVYQSFISTFEQAALVRQVLPLEPEVLEIMVRDIIPKEGKYSAQVKDIETMSYTVEPTPEAVLDTIFPQLVQIMVYHALLESKASEHSARMVAMKNATDKAEEVTSNLTLKFNKERQAVITAEVSEITGGIEAMKQH
jgi:F-type H+-transporting ATPase subunit gamma